MKRKTLLVFLLVALFSLVMATGVFAAETIILNEENPVLDLTGKNIEGPIIVESGDVTISGNGTVTGQVTIMGGNVTITGNSTFTGSANENAISVGGGNVTIEGGTFISNSGADINKYSALYVNSANSKATVTVNGGTFTGNGKDNAARVCGEYGAATLTINDGTFHAEYVTGLADCGGLFYINGGTWSSESEWEGQSDILNAKTIYASEVGKFVVAGGTFKNFDPTNIYSEGAYPTKEATKAYSLAEGYEFDAETGTVACAHEDLEEHEEVAATYEATGTKAYWSCETCGKWFEDEEATKEITDKTSVVTAKLVKTEEKPKDEEPKMGTEISTITIFAVVAVIALAGYVVSKKK